jgi:hypothetical protein
MWLSARSCISSLDCRRVSTGGFTTNLVISWDAFYTCLKKQMNGAIRENTWPLLSSHQFSIISHRKISFEKPPWLTYQVTHKTQELGFPLEIKASTNKITMGKGILSLRMCQPWMCQVTGWKAEPFTTSVTSGEVSSCELQIQNTGVCHPIFCTGPCCLGLSENTSRPPKKWSKIPGKMMHHWVFEFSPRKCSDQVVADLPGPTDVQISEVSTLSKAFQYYQAWRPSFFGPNLVVPPLF